MEIRVARTGQDIQAAVDMDEAVIGSRERATYIAHIADQGGLSLAEVQGAVRAFCALDHHHFFGKPFLSLLIVHPGARRLGLGQGLLRRCRVDVQQELWTSTNRSNAPMRALLAKSGWQRCGVILGLDEGDPELIYRARSA